MNIGEKDLPCGAQDECRCAKIISRLLSTPLHAPLAAGAYPLTQGVSITRSCQFCLQKGLHRVCMGKSQLLMLLMAKTSACRLHSYMWLVQ